MKSLHLHFLITHGVEPNINASLHRRMPAKIGNLARLIFQKTLKNKDKIMCIGVRLEEMDYWRLA